MAQIMKELPPDIKIDVLVDSSDFIVQSINNLSETLMYALIFVVLVVLLFLGMEGDVYHRTDHPDLVDRGIYLSFYHERIAKCHFPVLPFDCYRYGCGRRYRGFGKHHETHRTGKSAPREAAKYGTNEVWLSVIVTTLVTVAVFFPLTLVTGMTGILFKQLGYIVCITVCTSTVTAISLTPMLSFPATAPTR